VAGTWKDLTDSVNSMAGNLTVQLRDVSKVATAIATGDLTQKITVDVRGEILQIKDVINRMVDQLNAFAAEVTRVAKEVGTDGKLGSQAEVKGVAGTWKDLTDNVNVMAANLTDQVRGIAKVVSAVATGNVKQKLTVQAKGEIAALADTINNMIDTLAIFADQVTSVAREVGVEGRLGGQANVPGTAGTWKDLTDNVNQLAANLTTQVRAIADVATAVTKGDLTRTITVEARGEVQELKNNINEMIRNLRDTTHKREGSTSPSRSSAWSPAAAAKRQNPRSGPSIGLRVPTAPVRYSSSSPPSRASTEEIAVRTASSRDSPRTSAPLASVTARTAELQRASKCVRAERSGASSNSRPGRFA